MHESVLYLSHLRRNFLFQRPQHLLESLFKGAPVVLKDREKLLWNHVDKAIQTRASLRTSGLYATAGASTSRTRTAR